MSADITPTDLAKFVHPVPVGAIVPADIEHVVKVRDTFVLAVSKWGNEQTPESLPRWTAERILTPQHARLEAEYTAACERVYAAEAAMNAARSERDDAMPAAQRLYNQLRAEGLR